FRLICDRERALAQRLAELALQREHLWGELIHHLVITAEGVELFFCRVHRDVGAAEKLTRATRVLRVNRGSNTRRQIELDAAGYGSSSQALLQTVAQNLARLRRIHAPSEDRELVPAQSRDAGIRIIEAFPQPLADLLEHAVTGGVPEGIVDFLEAVQVEEQNRVRITWRGRNRLLELAHESI